MISFPSLFTGEIKGLRSLWFIGDEFSSRSFTSYFKQVSSPEKNGWFTQLMYELYEFTSTRYTSAVRNILARYKSLLLLAIKERKTLPTAIVLVPDDDIIKQTQLPRKEIEEGEYTNVIHYLMEEMHRMLANYANKLPKKAKEEYFPHLLWIAPPQHKYFANNFEREEFAVALESAVENFTNMCTL